MTQTDFEAETAANTLVPRDLNGASVKTRARRAAARVKAKAEEGAEVVKTQAVALRDKAAANPKKTAAIGAAVTGVLLSAGAVLWVALSDSRRSRAFDAFRALKSSALRR
ncbi:hypothetical protein ASG17_05030 [Brevundimonas sp. Leaf363]|uniref:hypothetical protein n=1 Tax=Brevundimonas sp. Leaf363 TaxID=1736353 RepID=UPI0006F7DF58|nr:hypothetical protein [Brevundimonas sp. Leaf363]KQS55453.1 hypothetical protein ASG17_05030 [Brevundimonas sp. Leaf363]